MLGLKKYDEDMVLGLEKYVEVLFVIVRIRSFFLCFFIFYYVVIIYFLINEKIS